MKKVSLKDFRAHLNTLPKVTLVLLDVREENEYNTAHIDGTINIPLGELEMRIAELKNVEEIVTICAHGRRATIACRLLEKHGFNNTSYLMEPIEEWELLEFPLVKGR